MLKAFLGRQVRRGLYRYALELTHCRSL